jgi:outer membrane receptor protein involved in Fe transport
MSRSRQFLALLLAGSALAGQPALAQDETSPPSNAAAQPPEEEPLPEEQVEVSAPGSEGLEIVVTGRFIPEPVRNTSQVMSVLSSEEIARTGEGEIAGALQRVTGLSVTSNGFVYVRGLGERYSLALLNGLALPSPEPLRRVVPLDIFPTSIISSAVVQKSYSVNFPGEYGGGVINLTTASLPEEDYLSVGIGTGGDSETSGQLGYMYYGSGRDWLGYDDGTRDLPAALRDNDGELVSANVLENEDTLILQRSHDVPYNFSASANAGYGTDFGDTRFGVLASVGYSNGWRTRGATQQIADGETLMNSSYGVRTENRIQANGLLSVGLDLPQGHTLRWTNVYIHDTSKVARVRGSFNNIQTPFVDLAPDRLMGPYDSLNYESSYVQRQLFTTQLVGELEFDALEIDLRGSYSNSQRKSPYERTTQYRYNVTTQGYAINFGSPSGVIFSILDEDVWAGGVDLAYELPTDISAKISAGYSYSDTSRVFQSLNFGYNDQGSSVLLTPNAYLPIYQLLSPEFVDFEQIALRQNNRAFGQAQYRGDLTVHGAYLRGEIEIVDGLRLEGGWRYETADQTLTLPDLYLNNPSAPGEPAVILKTNDYWLPAATLTWNFAENFQFRIHGSKTIARPQFRELGTIPVLDVESDRVLLGNPFLTDSRLKNAEARIEFYPARDERISLAGFFKRIDRPIESIATSDTTGALLISNANAPQAELYGAEAEVVKFFYLSDLGADDGFFASKRLLFSGNYTYSKSKLKVGADDTTILFGNNVNFPIEAPAINVFTPDSPLTGQSEHLANVQVGIEDTDKLQQLTFMLTYASERVISRGPRAGGVIDPDIIEKPGINFDIVARFGLDFEGVPLELKLEGRNLLGTAHEEVQEYEAYLLQSNVYDVGRSVSVSLSATF